MKLTNILFIGLLALVFTSTVDAAEYKMETCNIAERAFWDTYKKPYDRSTYNFLDKEDKISQIKLAKSNLEMAMNNVTERCKRLDKVIVSQYEKLQKDLLKELIKEQESL